MAPPGSRRGHHVGTAGLRSVACVACVALLLLPRAAARDSSSSSSEATTTTFFKEAAAAAVSGASSDEVVASSSAEGDDEPSHPHGRALSPSRAHHRQFDELRKTGPIVDVGWTYRVSNRTHDAKEYTADLYAPMRRVDAATTQVWALGATLTQTRRNHDCLVIDDTLDAAATTHPTMFNFMGRYARSIEAIDLVSGAREFHEPLGVDPDGFELANLNHVVAVEVPANPTNDGRREIWLPCGFFGDVVNHETSIDYVRIFDVETRNLTTGPRLPRSGGACAAIRLELAGESFVCVFGGTDGTHYGGGFLDEIPCWDFATAQWLYPFADLPVGLDHANVVFVPPQECGGDAADPTERESPSKSRLLMMNFRSEHYGVAHKEVWAYDLDPHRDVDLAQLRAGDPSAQRQGEWYVFASNDAADGDTAVDVDDDPLALHYLHEGRDAAGVVQANGGRLVYNFGGMHRYLHSGPRNKTLYSPLKQIREFDVCRRSWAERGNMGFRRFALQSCASHAFNVGITCGGQGHHPTKGAHETLDNNGNTKWCLMARFDGAVFDNDARPPWWEAGF